MHYPYQDKDEQGRGKNLYIQEQRMIFLNVLSVSFKYYFRLSNYHILKDANKWHIKRIISNPIG